MNNCFLQDIGLLKVICIEIYSNLWSITTFPKYLETGVQFVCKYQTDNFNTQLSYFELVPIESPFILSIFYRVPRKTVCILRNTLLGNLVVQFLMVLRLECWFEKKATASLTIKVLLSQSAKQRNLVGCEHFGQSAAKNILRNTIFTVYFN